MTTSARVGVRRSIWREGMRGKSRGLEEVRTFNWLGSRKEEEGAMTDLGHASRKMDAPDVQAEGARELSAQ